MTYYEVDIEWLPIQKKISSCEVEVKKKVIKFGRCDDPFSWPRPSAWAELTLVCTQIQPVDQLSRRKKHYKVQDQFESINLLTRTSVCNKRHQI